MEDNSYALIVEGLDRIDALELVEGLGEDHFAAETLGDDDQRLGEPGTIAIIAAIGTVAMPPLLVWLARRKKWFRSSDVQEVTLPDGTTFRRVVKISVGAAKPPSAAELNELAGMTGTSASDLAKLLAPAEDQ
ncbi:hypothetical protein [Parasphingopyxis sp.]|uniref:hypothetical protein n=1 Tax=Parasphingopyxis sp. TaxID=1920299 RepID=UPI0026199E19|nr:hypothetical protein [Parasphingopyxis sp.]